MLLGWLFHRRDTRSLALVMGGVGFSAVFLFAAGTPGWHPALQFGLGGAVGCAAGAVMIRLRRALPPDMLLVPVPPGTVDPDPETPPPGTVLLHVRLAPDRLRRGRLDVTLDGRRVAQLTQGTACSLTVPCGLHEIGVFFGSRRVRTATRFNALSGIPSG